MWVKQYINHPWLGMVTIWYQLFIFWGWFIHVLPTFCNAYFRHAILGGYPMFKTQTIPEDSKKTSRFWPNWGISPAIPSTWGVHHWKWFVSSWFFKVKYMLSIFGGHLSHQKKTKAECKVSKISPMIFSLYQHFCCLNLLFLMLTYHQDVITTYNKVSF